MRAIVDAGGDDGNLSPEKTTEFETREKELGTVEAAIRREETLDELDRRSTDVRPVTHTVQGDPLVRDIRTKYSLCRAIAGHAGLNVDWAFEREVAQEVQTRAQGRKFEGLAIPLQAMETRVITAIAGSGAGVIPTEHRPDMYIDRLRAQLITARLGATYLSDLHGNVSIPRNSSSDTAQWFQENTSLTPLNKSFDAVTLTPHHCGMVTEYSRNLLLQSSPDIEQLLRSDFAKELALAVDRAALAGDGFGGAPIGITRTAGVQTISSMGAGPTWDGVLSIIQAVEGANAVFNGWAMGSSAKKKLMTTPKQSTGSEGNWIMTEPGSLAGYPAFQSEITVETGSPGDQPLIGGAWENLLIGSYSGVDLLTNPYESSAYLKGNVLVRGIISVDIAIRHPEAFCFAPDIGPA
jgi:HK97 family phage major capsid protein